MLPQAVNRSSRKPHVLTVAGSDSGGGAGIQADIKACGALGVYCSTAITALTAQNTMAVQGIHVTPEEIFARQLEAVLSDMEVDVVKTGMLPTPQIVNILCSHLESYSVKGLVVDPVFVATSGDQLTSHEVVDVIRKKLLPLADIVTPNLPEAAVLSGKVHLRTCIDMHETAKIIKDFGPRYVLVKGGHLDHVSAENVDVLYDGETFWDFHGTWVETMNTHGTGCTLASCIAAEMAKGNPVPVAVQAAKDYIQRALEHSKHMKIAKGLHGPLDHFFSFPEYSKISRCKGFQTNSLRLYAVIDLGMKRRWQCSAAEALRCAIEGGATIVQLREKETGAGDFLKKAESCVEVSRKSRIPLLINDRLDIAMACEADGVHLEQSGLPVKQARRLLGSDKIIGVSCKSIEQAQKAYEDGADYVVCGPVYPTTTEENSITVGLDGLYAICRATSLPVVPIGGINASNVEEILTEKPTTLHGIAVVSELFDKPDICKAMQELAGMIYGFFHDDVEKPLVHHCCM